MAERRSPPWEDLVTAERMAADREFQERVHSSGLTNQSWGLVMMAVDFEIVDPETPEEAYFVIDSTGLDNVLPAMREADEVIGGPQQQQSKSSKGAVEYLRSLLGTGPSDDHLREEAEELAEEYAHLLQRHLVENGKWEAVCTRAVEAS